MHQQTLQTIIVDTFVPLNTMLSFLVQHLKSYFMSRPRHEQLVEDATYHLYVK